MKYYVMVEGVEGPYGVYTREEVLELNYVYGVNFFESMREATPEEVARRNA